MHSYIYATYVHWSDHWYYFGLRFSARIMEIMNSSHCGSKGTCKPGPAPVHSEDRMDYQGHDEGKKEHSKTSRTKLFISKNKLAIVMGKTVETLWDKGHSSFTGLSAQVSQTRKLHLLEHWRHIIINIRAFILKRKLHGLGGNGPLGGLSKDLPV